MNHLGFFFNCLVVWNMNVIFHFIYGIIIIPIYRWYIGLWLSHIWRSIHISPYNPSIYGTFIGKTLVQKSQNFPRWPPSARPRPDESTRHRGVAVPTLLRLLRPSDFVRRWWIGIQLFYGHRMNMNGYNIVEYVKIQLIWKYMEYIWIYIYIYETPYKLRYRV